MRGWWGGVGRRRIVSISNIRTWVGGPLQQMAASRASGAFIPFAKTINGCHFAGRYVCDGCQEHCAGVSLQNDGKLSGNRHSRWLCDLCIRGQKRKTRTPEQRQAVIDRLAAARRDRTASCTNTRRKRCRNVQCSCGSIRGRKST